MIGSHSPENKITKLGKKEAEPLFHIRAPRSDS